MRKMIKQPCDDLNVPPLSQMRVRRRCLSLFLFLLALIADRVTKYCALSGLLGRLYANYGISFSLLEKHAPASLLFAFAGMGILGYACIKSRTARFAPGMPLLWAGAASNLADRLLYGYVIDWIPAVLSLNLADLWLCIGSVQLFKYSILRTPLSAQSRKN
jgi:signal peptidase II